MSKKDDPEFRDSIQKLRELREELCSKQTVQSDAFQARDFVIDELQEMHEKLRDEPNVPPWCVRRVKYILTQMLALPLCKVGGGEDV
jgi:hypothetical protein